MYNIMANLNILLSITMTNGRADCPLRFISREKKNKGLLSSFPRFRHLVDAERTLNIFLQEKSYEFFERHFRLVSQLLQPIVDSNTHNLSENLDFSCSDEEEGLNSKKVCD